MQKSKLQSKNQKSDAKSEKTSVHKVRAQHCLMCLELMGDMPGSRDAYCKNCGYKDPCCE